MLAQAFLNLYNSSAVASNVIATERTVIGFFLNWIRLIGTGLALIMLTFMSLHYLNTTPIRREEIKQRIGNFAIGAIVFIGASNILYYTEQIVEQILQGVFA